MRTTISLVLLAVALGAAEPPKLSNADTAAWGDHVQVGDGIFPAEPAAASAISFTPGAFLDHGSPAFVASASMHYARVPRDLWEDRIVRLKRLGYTWIETYVFWNYHEPVEGHFDFTGERDLPAFLALCQQHGLRVLLRVGPYSCAEWTEGGFPTWLRTREGMRLRVDDARYLEAVCGWFNALLPIVAKAQVHRGGPVAMLQLENEHPHGGGTSANDQGKVYFNLLRNLARRNGIEVPYFFSGLHHSHDPAGDKPWDVTGRQNPWLATEFWTTWYSDRGPGKPEVTTRKARSVWKMIAFGAAGFNCYMAHGGTTFGAWNNNEAEASYDFGAPVGQVGDIRPFGHRIREANLFATTCADLLLTPERTTEAPAPAPGLRRFERGTIAFLDNPTGNATKVAVPGHGDLHLAASEIAPLFIDARIDPVFTVTGGRVLARLLQGDTTTLALRVYPEDALTLTVRAEGLPDGVARVPLAAEGRPAVTELKAGGRTLRIVALGPDLADRTWLVADGGTPTLVVGSGLPLALTADHLTAEAGGGVATLFGAGPVVERRPVVPAVSSSRAALGTWSVATAVAEAGPTFNAAGWLTAREPVQLGLAGGTPTAAWYRTELVRDTAASGVLRCADLADHGQVFLDGGLLGQVGGEQDSLPIDLAAGRHVLAIYASHSGRDKMFFNTGVMATNDRKGLYGAPRLLVAGQGTGEVAGWRWRPLTEGGTPQAEVLNADPTGPEWAAVPWGKDLFQNQRGRALAVARFDAPVGAEVELHFAAIDDEAEVWCNGVRLGHHRGWNQPFTIAVPAKALQPKGNRLALVITNTDGAGGMSGPAVTAAWSPMPGSGDGRVLNWTQRDVAEVPPEFGYVPFTAAPGLPAFVRTTLTVHPVPGQELRLAWGGLGRGQAWLNGHALGRYPDRLDARGLWLPPCWLKDGANDLVIQDELGRDPTGVRVVADGESPGAALTWR